MFKVNKDTRTTSVTILLSFVNFVNDFIGCFIVNFELIARIFLMFILFIFNIRMFA